MNVSSVQAPILQTPTLPTPILSPEEMIAVAAARPAALQQQAVALASMHNSIQNGTTGEGTPAVDANGHVDLYA
jgi:hypothetical protein